MTYFSDRAGGGMKPLHPDQSVSAFELPARTVDRHPPYKRIAVEEAWCIPELIEAQRTLIASATSPTDPSLQMAAMLLNDQGLQEELCEVGPERLARMDAMGIDRQLLLLTAPGVQVLDPDKGTALASLSNDRLADICRNHPERFSGLLAFAPQNVPGAVAEIERGMTKLGLAGAVINSNTQGHYLDEPQFLPILEALEANDAALYIHPTVLPSPGNDLYAERALSNTAFTHEVWFHTMALICSGAFDRFPKLRLVIGHMGEALPLLLYRLDWWQISTERRAGQPPIHLKHRISHYFRNNIWITTSGVPWEPAIKFCQSVLGPDRVLFAQDYPYQASGDEIAAYDAMDMPAEHKKMLMQTNAEQVFRL